MRQSTAVDCPILSLILSADNKKLSMLKSSCLKIEIVAPASELAPTYERESHVAEEAIAKHDAPSRYVVPKGS